MAKFAALSWGQRCALWSGPRPRQEEGLSVMRCIDFLRDHVCRGRVRRSNGYQTAQLIIEHTFMQEE